VSRVHTEIETLQSSLYRIFRSNRVNMLCTSKLQPANFRLCPLIDHRNARISGRIVCICTCNSSCHNDSPVVLIQNRPKRRNINNVEFLLQILLLAQHVSGTIMSIIRSSRVLYKWLLSVVFGTWFSSCLYSV
jgi:hypothetical protein